MKAQGFSSEWIEDVRVVMMTKDKFGPERFEEAVRRLIRQNPTLKAAEEMATWLGGTYPENKARLAFWDRVSDRIRQIRIERGEQV